MTIIQAKSENDLTLGRQGENLARQVVFDLSAWEAEYGPGTVELIHQRPGDTSPYPVAAVREGSTLVWTLTATDTAVASSYGSDGHCELRYYVGEVLVKSRTWLTKIIRAMSTPSETAPPEPEQGWVEQVLAAGAAAKASADAAKADADRAAALAAEVSKKAAQTAQDASDAAKAMEAAQIAQRLAEEAQSAAEAARTAAAAAQAAAETAATDAAGAKQGAETAQKAAQDAAAAAAKALADIRALYQEMQTWAQGVIQDVNDAGSAAVQSVQSAGDTQVQRVTDEGTTQTANAKAQADAAAQSASEAAQSAQQAAESTSVYDTVVADVTQLKQDLTHKADRASFETKDCTYVVGGYVNYNEGTITSTQNASHTDYMPIVGAKRIEAYGNMGSAGAVVAFYDDTKQYMRDLSVAGTRETTVVIDLTEEKYQKAAYVIASVYGDGNKYCRIVGQYNVDEIEQKADKALEDATRAIGIGEAALTIVEPKDTTFFDLNYASNIVYTNRYPGVDGVIHVSSNANSAEIPVQGGKYYFFFPGTNRTNIAYSENDEFVTNTAYSIVPHSIYGNYGGTNIIVCDIPENAKRVMFYFFFGDYDDSMKSSVVVRSGEWNPSTETQLMEKYIPKSVTRRHFRTFSVIGDSYSSFSGYMADPNAATWYPASSHGMDDTNDVERVDQTWWWKFANEYGCRLIENNSWSGSTVSYDGYGTGLIDGKETSFIERSDLLTNPELIIVFGATNDSWVATDTGRTDFLGTYMYKPYADYTDSDLTYFRPALACLFDKLTHRNVGAKIVFVLNQSTSNIKDSVTAICQHFGIPVLQLNGISLGHSHPTEAGMETIKDQLIDFLATID